MNNMWHQGKFNENEELEGEGSITVNYKFKFLQDGIFKNGILVKGELYSKDKNKWYVGSFNETGLLHGTGYVYEGYNKERLIQVGTFDNGVLIEGEHFACGVWLKGKFVMNDGLYLLNGPHCTIWSDYEKKILQKEGSFENGVFIEGILYNQGDVEASGKFKNDKLVEGRKKIGNYWYTGTFNKNEELDGEGSVLCRYTHKIIEKGTYHLGKLIKGYKMDGDRKYIGCFDEFGKIECGCYEENSVVRPIVK